MKDFAVINDLHVQHSTGAGLTRLQDVVKDIARHHPAFVMVNGDLIDPAAADITAAVGEQLRRTMRLLPCPVFYGIGNHESGGVPSNIDCTPTNMAAFYNLVEDAFTRNPEENTAAAETLGYYKFFRAGIHFIVLNSVELANGTEGDYALRAAQKTWLTNTLAAITGSTARVIVFSHVDPAQTTASIYYRMLAADAAAVRTALENWRTSTGGKVLAVISAHEHGTQNASQNRVTRLNSIDYLNLIDGRKTNNASNIKPDTYASGSRNTWSLVSWDEATNRLIVRGQNGGTNHVLTPA